MNLQWYILCFVIMGIVININIEDTHARCVLCEEERGGCPAGYVRLNGQCMPIDAEEPDSDYNGENNGRNSGSDEAVDYPRYGCSDDFYVTAMTPAALGLESEYKTDENCSAVLTYTTTPFPLNLTCVFKPKRIQEDQLGYEKLQWTVEGAANFITKRIEDDLIKVNMNLWIYAEANNNNFVCTLIMINKTEFVEQKIEIRLKHASPTTTTPSSSSMNLNGLCYPNEFQCASNRCVLKKWICDGENDCGDNSDEADCGPSVAQPGECLPVEFKCHIGEQCVRKSFHCDGATDCLDGSDEIGCSTPTTTPPTTHFITSTIITTTPVPTPTTSKINNTTNTSVTPIISFDNVLVPDKENKPWKTRSSTTTTTTSTKTPVPTTTSLKTTITSTKIISENSDVASENISNLSGQQGCHSHSDCSGGLCCTEHSCQPCVGLKALQTFTKEETGGSNLQVWMIVACVFAFCFVVIVVAVFVWKYKQAKAKREAQPEDAVVYSYVAVEKVSHYAARALIANNQRLGERSFVPRVPQRPNEFAYDYARPKSPPNFNDQDYDYATVRTVRRNK